MEIAERDVRVERNENVRKIESVVVVDVEENWSDDWIITEYEEEKNE